MKRKPEKRPWGRMIGLLTACAVTLIGVAVGIDPDAILVRACVASVITGSLAATAAGVLETLTQRTGNK